MKGKARHRLRHSQRTSLNALFPVATSTIPCSGFNIRPAIHPGVNPIGDHKYEEYMQGQGHKKLPGVGFKKLKKIMKRCRKEVHSHGVPHGDGVPHDTSTCPQHCPG